MDVSAAILSPGFLVLELVALAATIFCIIDVAIRPEWAWNVSGQSKPLWLVLTIVALFIGFFGLILDVAYLISIRPKVGAARGRGQVTGGSAMASGYGSGFDYGTSGGYPPPPASSTLPPSPPPASSTPPPPPGLPPAGWYPDPKGSGPRYWDGRSWSTKGPR